MTKSPAWDRLKRYLKTKPSTIFWSTVPQQIFVERAGKLELTDVTFKDEKPPATDHRQDRFRAVGRRVDESNPYVDARLKDGSRFNAMVPPVAVDGSTGVHS